MKKIFIVLLVVLLLAVIGFGIYYIWQSKTTVAVEDVLPSGALLYVNFANLRENISQFSANPVWKSIEHLNYGLLVSKGLITRQQASTIDQIKKTIDDFNPAITGEVALALYPPQENLPAIGNVPGTELAVLMKYAYSNGYLVIRTDPMEQVAETMFKFLGQPTTGILTEDLNYQGKKYYRMTIPKMNIKVFYVRVKDLLVVTIDEKAIQRTLDVLSRSQLALKDDSKFKQAKSKFLPQAAMIAFIDMENLIGTFQGQYQNMMKGLEATLAKNQQDPQKIERLRSRFSRSQKRFEDVLTKTKGIKALGISMTFDELSTMKTNLFFDPAQLNRQLTFDYSCPSSENSTFNFIPKEITGYSWANCFNPVVTWEQIKKQADEMAARTMNASSAPDKNLIKPPPLSSMTEIMGLNIKGDILPAFGDEAGGFLKNVEMSENFPVPKILFFVKIKDEEKAQRVVSTLMDQKFFVLQNEEYHGVAIKYLTLPTGGEPKPAYCFLNGYLLVGVDPQVIKDALDATDHADGNLLANVSFQEINKGLSERSRIIQFIQFDKLIDQLKSFVDWTVTFGQKQIDNKMAFKTGSEKRLAEINDRLTLKESELQSLDTKMADLDAEIKKLKTQGVPTSEKENELTKLSLERKSKDDALKEEYAQKNSLISTLNGFDEGIKSIQEQKVFNNEIFYPLLDGFRSVKSFSTRTTLEDKNWETWIFLKMGRN